MTTSNQYKGLEIGVYQPQEEAGVLDCKQICYGSEQESDRWRHLYGDSPSGEPIRFVARDRDVIVGHAAILPRQFTAFGANVLAGFSTGAMTRPEWRRKGISRILVTKAQEVAERRGFSLFYSTPNQLNVGNALKYQGRRAVGLITYVLRPVRPFHTGLSVLNAKLLGKQPSVSNSFDENTWMKPSFDDRYSKLFAEVDALPPISAVRNLSYLAWRYPGEPTSPYLQRDIQIGDTVEATLIVRISGQFGIPLVFVMEWLWRTNRRPVAFRLIQEAMRLSRSVGAYGVAALAMPGTVQRRMLYRMGFLPLPQIFLPQKLTLTTSPKSKLEEAGAWYKRSSWNLTFGDGTTL